MSPNHHPDHRPRPRRLRRVRQLDRRDRRAPRARLLRPSPSPTLCAACEADAAYLRSVIDSIDGPVVVVGHSYGGAVMSIAADGADRVKALVYIASFNLEVGESAGELAAKFPGGELGTVLDPKPFPSRRRGHRPLHPAATSSTARSPPTSRRTWPS